MASITICKRCPGFYIQTKIDYYGNCGIPGWSGDDEYYCRPPGRGVIYGPFDADRLAAFKAPKACPYLAEQKVMEWNSKEKIK